MISCIQGKSHFDNVILTDIYAALFFLPLGGESCRYKCNNFCIFFQLILFAFP